MQSKITAKELVFLAGAAGGTVEVIWVLIYCLGSPLSASLVAEEVTRSFLPQMAGIAAVMTGVLIHYVLAMMIAGVAAIAYLRVLACNVGGPTIYASSITALITIWAVNFFIVLPVLNPVFVTLMPYTVTLVSKIGFGISMGWIFAVSTSPIAGESRQRSLSRLALR